MTLVSNLINGISLGSVYAIIALGYTMVYGIAKMLNFAHGDVIMVGAYMCFCSMTYLSLPPIVSILIAMVVCTLLGVIVEVLAYRPLRKASSLAVLITAIGVSYLLQNAALLIWGSAPKTFSSVVPFGSVSLFNGDLIITGESIVTVAACVVIMICLTVFTKKSRMGKAMRAVSEDKDAAQLMGINVNKIISLVFFIGAGLGGIAGVMVGMYYGQISFTMGWLYGLKAFTAAILGGIGNIPGAMLGGLLLGVVETLAASYLSIGWKDAVAFFILIIILVVRPTGLLGERVADKL